MNIKNILSPLRRAMQRTPHNPSSVMANNQSGGRSNLASIIVLLLFSLLNLQAAQAQITFVGSSDEPPFPASGVGNTDSTSVTVAVPGAAQEGDFMMAILSVKGGGTAIDNPQSGWQTIEVIDQDPKLGLFYRFADADDADGTQGSYTFTWDDSKEHVGAIVVYRNVDATAPIVANTSATGKGTTPTAPIADRGTIADTMVVRAITQKDTDNTTLADFWPLPSATDNERVEVHWTKKDNKTKVSLSVADRTEAATGNTPAAALSSGVNKDWAAATVVLKPLSCPAGHIYNTASVAGESDADQSNNLDYICTEVIPAIDYGDAPASYGDAVHNITPTLYLGDVAPDAETGTQGLDGLGDNNTGIDDEDGVTFYSPAGGDRAEIYADVEVINDSGGVAYVCAWIDRWTDSGGSAVLDGAFGAGDIATTPAQACQSVVDNNGTATTVTFRWGNLPDVFGFTYARFRVCTTQSACQNPVGSALDGEVEDYRIDFDFTPTAVTIGRVDLQAAPVTEFLGGLGGDGMDKSALLALLETWDSGLAAALADADWATLLEALQDYLDPDGDGQVAVLRWETLEERGTIGFYVDRWEEDGSWVRINNDMLPGLVTAPMGGEYLLADPGARPGTGYQYQLIEQEARGTTRAYGPYNVEMPQ